MRSAGVITSGRDLGEHDHLCWSYDSDDDFLARAVEFLTDGAALGQRITYVGEAPEGELIERLRVLDGFDELLKRGAAGVVSTGAMYEAGEVVGPSAQVQAYAAATHDAVAAGFNGLRVAAEATSLVRTEAQRTAFARYEHLIDRAMRTMPFAAMCGYDRRVLDPVALTEIACLHPLATVETAPFRVFAVDGADLALAGEVDTMTAPAFARARHHAVPTVDGHWLDVDASTLSFIDHTGLLALDDLGRSATPMCSCTARRVWR